MNVENRFKACLHLNEEEKPQQSRVLAGTRKIKARERTGKCKFHTKGRRVSKRRGKASLYGRRRRKPEWVSGRKDSLGGPGMWVLLFV